MRPLAAFLTALLACGCSRPSVTDLSFPVVLIRADHSVSAHLTAESLTTTTRQRIEKLPGAEIFDRSGSVYSIESVKEIDPPGMLADFAGIRPFRVDLTLERTRRLSPDEAIREILDTLLKYPGYLDLAEGGREAVAAELEGRSFDELAGLLATRYEPNRVQRKAIERGNRAVEGLAERGE